MKRPMLSLSFNQDRMAERIDAMREREHAIKSRKRQRKATTDFVRLNGRKYVPANDAKTEADRVFAKLTGGGDHE